MIKHYFMQALSQLRQQPIIGVVNVLGTMLAIFLIMLVVMIQRRRVIVTDCFMCRVRALSEQVQGTESVMVG